MKLRRGREWRFQQEGLFSLSITEADLKGNGVRPISTTRARLMRGVSVQVAGGPRLKGSPGEEADRTAFWKTADIVAAAGGSSSACCSGGRQRACTPQRSQWPETGEVSPTSGSVSPTKPALAVGEVTLQRPPSLPVRMSSVSMFTGDSNAEKTARNPSHAARRAHSGRVRGKDEAIGTGRL